MNITIKLWIFKFAQLLHFSLKIQFWLFKPIFFPKGYFWFKTEKMNITNKLCIFKLTQLLVHDVINLLYYEHWKDKRKYFYVQKDNFDFLNQIFSKSLSAKFQLKLTILIFRTKFSKKSIFGLKQKKWTWPLNSAYSNYSRCLISTWNDNFNFLHEICLKRVF